MGKLMMVLRITVSDSIQSTLSTEPHPEVEATAMRVDPIIEHEYDNKKVEYSNNNNSIDRNDNELYTKNNEKKAPP